MNVALAYETALATVIRQFADIGGDTHIRVWRNLRFDNRWKADEDRHIPCVDIRAGMPQTDDEQHTLQIEGQVQVYTNSADDLAHTQIGAIEESIQDVLDKLFFGSLCEIGNDESTLFLQTLSELTGENFNFGGLTFGNGITPMDEAGFNALGFSLVLHYSRSDF